MRKILSIALLLCIFNLSGNGQSIDDLYLEVGGVRSSFQDIKYSAVRYNGFGGFLKFGFENKKAQTIWGANFSTLGSSESATTHDSGQALNLFVNIQAKYLRAIAENIYLGAKWDLVGFQLRNVQGLGNNSIYYTAGTNFSAAGLYQWNKFNFGLDLTLLSFIKEGTSFAFSSPQSGLEDGEFDYQNEALDNPFGLSYWKPRFLHQHFLLRTHINYQLNERLVLGYHWSLRKYAEVKNYPVTIGASRISLRWNFIHKQKEIPQN